MTTTTITIEADNLADLSQAIARIGAAISDIAADKQDPATATPPGKFSGINWSAKTTTT